MASKFKVGDLVWGKMKSFPAWPGKIIEAKPEIKKPMAKKGQVHQLIFFYGSENYAWILEDTIYPYVKYREKFMLKSRMPKGFKEAVECIDDAVLKQPEEISAEDLPSIDGELEQIQSGDTAAPPTKARKTTVTKKLAKVLPKAIGGALAKKRSSSSHKSSDINKTEKVPKAKQDKKRKVDVDAVYAGFIKRRPSVSSTDSNMSIEVAEPRRKKRERKQTAKGLALKNQQGPRAKAEPVRKEAPKKFTALQNSKSPKKKRLLEELTPVSKRGRPAWHEARASPKGADAYDADFNRPSIFDVLGNGIDSDEEEDVKDTKPKRRRPSAQKSEIPDGGAATSPRTAHTSPSKHTVASGSPPHQAMATSTTSPHTKDTEIDDDDVPSLSDKTRISTQTPGGSRMVPTRHRIGFLGLGIIGRGIVLNLLCTGHEVMVWNRTGHKCREFIREGAHHAQTPADVVEHCDITFACVSDPGAAKDLVFGNSGVLQGIGPGKGYVDMSTVDVETVEDINEAITARGGRFLEAPVSGSKVPALDGELIILAAGDKQLFADCYSCFDSISKRAFYLGSVGAGARMQLVMNLMIGSVMATLAEGLALAEKVGLDQEDVGEVLQLSSLSCPLVNHKSQAILNQNYDAHFPLQHQQKDMRLALNLGDQVEQPLYVASAANELFKKARRLGYGTGDISSVYRATST